MSPEMPPFAAPTRLRTLRQFRKWLQRGSYAYTKPRGGPQLAGAETPSLGLALTFAKRGERRDVPRPTNTEYQGDNLESAATLVTSNGKASFTRNLHGVHDFQTPYPVARALFEAIDAPEKTFYEFESSAHSPPFEEPERFNMLIRKHAGLE